MDLQIVGKESLLIIVFAKDVEDMRELDRIEVKCRRRNSVEVLDTSTIEKICTNISNSQVDFARTRYEHLQGLQLADAWCKDDTQYDLEIYLSIGLDQHWSVAGDEIYRRKERPLEIIKVWIHIRIVVI